MANRGFNRGFSRGRGSFTVAHKDWLNICSAGSSIDLASNTKALGAVGIAFSLPGTILRQRGTLFLQLDAGAVDERAVIAAGTILVSSAAFAAGVASVPGPASDSDNDWIWYSSAVISSLAEGAIQSDALFTRIDMDSKAMRKVKPDDVMVLVLEVCTSIDQTGTFDFMYSMRQLVGQ